MELTRLKIESCDLIFFTGTRARSRVSGNDRLFPRGSEFGPNPEIPASPVILLRLRPGARMLISENYKKSPELFSARHLCSVHDVMMVVQVMNVCSCQSEWQKVSYASYFVRRPIPKNLFEKMRPNFSLRILPGAVLGVDLFTVQCCHW